MYREQDQDLEVKIGNRRVLVVAVVVVVVVVLMAGCLHRTYVIWKNFV